MLFRMDSRKTTKSSSPVVRPTGHRYDSLLGITYFDVKKDSKRHEEAAVSAAREPASMTRLNSETSPVPASERSFVLITAVGLPMIDLSEWDIVDSPAFTCENGKEQN
ncbi:hypothetical protein PCANC_11630 [Puccinia coronata f. sp. avenae]|uniref:Uncharacterized protein n=2 Tax=Puccinia coronata f. sp. avenae TaxID=200324 RepID=A0A2N5SVL9_9BASI|nr:hypothetical protein PCANC_11630 [Puccinia coronata f. sp. avenae]